MNSDLTELLRQRDEIDTQIAMHRARASGLIKGDAHAQHRRPEPVSDSPARRKSDAADAALAADVAAEAERARDRDRERRQRAYANEHPGQ